MNQAASLLTGQGIGQATMTGPGSTTARIRGPEACTKLKSREELDPNPRKVTRSEYPVWREWGQGAIEPRVGSSVEMGPEEKWMGAREGLGHLMG